MSQTTDEKLQEVKDKLAFVEAARIQLILQMVFSKLLWLPIIGIFTHIFIKFSPEILWACWISYVYLTSVAIWYTYQSKKILQNIEQLLKN